MVLPISLRKSFILVSNMAMRKYTLVMYVNSFLFRTLLLLAILYFILFFIFFNLHWGRKSMSVQQVRHNLNCQRCNIVPLVHDGERLFCSLRNFFEAN
jgi:hypothetical protein